MIIKPLELFTSLKVQDSFVKQIYDLNRLSEGYLQDVPPTLIKTTTTTTRISKSTKTDTKSRKQITRSSKMMNKQPTQSKTDTILQTLNTLLEDTWYVVKTQNKRVDTFYAAALTILDDEFCTRKPREYNRLIHTLKKKMAVDLVSENLYRRFHYHHDRSFKRSTLEHDLNENRTTDVTRRYLTDYFNINVICIRRGDRRTVLYRDPHSTVSIIMILEDDGTFSTVLSSSGNHFIHPKSFHKILKRYPTEQTVEKPKPVDKPKYKSLKLSDIDYSQDKFKLYSISSYTIDDLCKIADEYEIPTERIFEYKSGQRRPKRRTKREIYDDILKHHGL